MGSVNLNFEKLSSFSNVNFKDENTTVRFSGREIKSAGTWNKGNIFRWARSAGEKADNNAVRTRLLESLGEAFGISEGIGTDGNGNKTFSRAFMDRLENILGPAFKRSDFFAGSGGGAVNSGKPLTQRRISAIIKQAQIVGKSDFSLDVYDTKAKAMLANSAPNSKVGKFANKVIGMISFLKDSLPKLIEKNSSYDPEFDEGEEAPYYSTLPEKEEEGAPEVRIPFNKGRVQNHLSKLGYTFHFRENMEAKGDIPPNEYPPKMFEYVNNTISTFIKLSVDLYEQLKDTDKKGDMEAAFAEIVDFPACMEGMTTSLMELQGKAGVGEASAQVVDHDMKTPLVECMYKEVGVIMQGRDNESPSWSECRPILERNLVGKQRPLENGGELKTITVEDIDGLKQAFKDILLGEE